MHDDEHDPEVEGEGGVSDDALLEDEEGGWDEEGEEEVGNEDDDEDPFDEFGGHRGDRE